MEGKETGCPIKAQNIRNDGLGGLEGAQKAQQNQDALVVWNNDLRIEPGDLKKAY